MHYVVKKARQFKFNHVTGIQYWAGFILYEILWIHAQFIYYYWTALFFSMRPETIKTNLDRKKSLSRNAEM